MPHTAPLPETPLPAGERQLLRRLAGLMIPASAAHGVPGADDDAIQADILRSLGRDARAVRDALVALGSAAPGDLAAAVQRLRVERPLLVHALANVVSRCYYRDDRVMRAIGIEPRPPFPQGYAVEQGDWSLLEPVRRRGPIWRPVP